VFVVREQRFVAGHGLPAVVAVDEDVGKANARQRFA
jgi:hypothetical protein